jgi:hypothetical protein
MEGSNQAALKWQEAEEPTIKPGISESKSQNHNPKKRATQCLNEVKTEEVEAAAAAQRGALADGE